MGRPTTRRATVDDVDDWDNTDLESVPIPAATNTHDHSLYVKLADGSKLRVDRDFAEEAFQRAYEQGMRAWRTPTEYMRACLAIGMSVVIEAGYTSPEIDAMVKLDLAEAKIAQMETLAFRLQHLRENGQHVLADEIEKTLGGVETDVEEVGQANS